VEETNLENRNCLTTEQSVLILPDTDKKIKGRCLQWCSNRENIIIKYHDVMIISITLAHNMKLYYLLTRNTAEDKAGTQD